LPQVGNAVWSERPDVAHERDVVRGQLRDANAHGDLLATSLRRAAPARCARLADLFAGLALPPRAPASRPTGTPLGRSHAEARPERASEARRGGETVVDCHLEHGLPRMRESAAAARSRRSRWMSSNS